MKLKIRGVVDLTRACHQLIRINEMADKAVFIDPEGKSWVVSKATNATPGNTARFGAMIFQLSQRLVGKLPKIVVIASGVILSRRYSVGSWIISVFLIF